MESPKDVQLDTENLQLHPEKVPSPFILQQRTKNDQKSVLKIKGCSPLDASSNLEFTQKRSKLYLADSLQGLQAIEPSHTIQKIQQNNSSSVSSKANKVPRRVQNHPKENDNTERIHAVIKEIFDSENELPLWKIWPGNNRFFFEGKLMTGPESDKFPNLAAWVFVIALNVVFFAAALPFLVDELMSLLPALSSYLCLSTVIFFLLTSFTDPGIIPRKCVWELDGEVPNPYKIPSRKDHSRSLTHNTHRRTEESPLEFCTICQIHRPPQAKHCKFCGNCVEVFGGHLRIFSNCIGKRNYRFFVGFITSMVLLTIFYVICFVTLMVQSFQGDLGGDVDAGSGSGFADKTVNIVIGVLVGLPTLIFMSIKLGLFIYFLMNRAQRRANQGGNEGLGIALKGISADWCESEPSRINSRKVIGRTQLRKYKAALENEQHTEETCESVFDCCF